jgi:hypothetical protein
LLSIFEFDISTILKDTRVESSKLEKDTCGLRSARKNFPTGFHRPDRIASREVFMMRQLWDSPQAVRTFDPAKR